MNRQYQEDDLGFSSPRIAAMVSVLVSNCTLVSRRCKSGARLPRMVEEGLSSVFL